MSLHMLGSAAIVHVLSSGQLCIVLWVSACVEHWMSLHMCEVRLCATVCVVRSGCLHVQ